MIGCYFPYKLKDFLLPQQEIISVEPNTEYKQIKLRLYQKGAELRALKKGSELGSKQYLAKEGQFIISKIDARNGAMAIVPKELDGAVVTGDFLLYNIDESIVNKEYFNLYTRLGIFNIACKASSEGSTNRVRLKVDRFHNIPVLFPATHIQSLLLEKVKFVEEKTQQIVKLKIEQRREFENLVYSKYVDLIREAEWMPMSEVAPIVRRDVDIKEDSIYPELGIRCFGKGTFHKQPLTGLEVGTKTLYQIKAGDLMFSNVFAWEGAIAVAKEEDNNRYGSHRFISCVVDKDLALAEFLCFHFLTEKGMIDINLASPGGAGRNKTLGLDKLMKIKVPVPDVDEQREFVALLHQIEEIQREHKKTEDELSELIPSLLDKAFKGELTV